MTDTRDERSSTLSAHEHHASMPDKLEKEHLLALFPKLGYEPIVDRTAFSNNPNEIVPVYYHHAQILLFPPSTDNPNNNLVLNGVAQNIDRACRLDQNLLATKDLIVFPILEEWNVMRKPRRSWVLVVYDRTTQFLHLIDPTGHRRPDYYETAGNLKPLERAVTEKFTEKNILITANGKLLLQKNYLGIQDKSDNVSSGHWISYILYRLNQGETLTNVLQNEYSLTSKPTIQGVRDDLLHLMHPETQDDLSEPINGNESSNDILVLAPKFEVQNYGQPGPTPSSDTRSFLSSGDTLNNSVGPAPSHRFRLDVYTSLIFAGTGLTLIALVCLSGVISVVPTAIATSMVGLATVMFLGGVLGKLGVFRALSGSGAGGENTNTLRSFSI